MELVCKSPQRNANGRPSADRKWFLTINNWTAEEDEAAKEAIKLCNYGAYSAEIGKEEETPHLHIWLHFKNARSFASIKKMFPRANIKVGKGTDAQATAYITKDGPVRGAFGEPSKQGSRGDLEEIRELGLTCEVPYLCDAVQ